MVTVPRLSIMWECCDFVFVLISWVGVQSCDEFIRNKWLFIPTLGPKEPQWGSFKLICTSASLLLCISVSLSGRLPHLLVIIHSSRNCAQRMRPQATGSNHLSGSIICPSDGLYGCPRAFCDFGICIDFQCGGPASRCIYCGVNILLKLRKFTGLEKNFIDYIGV